MKLDSDIISCMGSTPQTNRSYFLLLRVIFSTLLLFSGFGLKTRDWSELPVSVLREHFKLLNGVFVFRKFFIKKGSVMTKFIAKNSLLYLLSNNVYIGINIQECFFWGVFSHPFS